MANLVCEFAKSRVDDACAALAIFLTIVRPISLHSLGVEGRKVAQFWFIIKTNYPSLHLPIRCDFQVPHRRKKNRARTKTGTMAGRAYKKKFLVLAYCFFSGGYPRRGRGVQKNSREIFIKPPKPEIS